MPKVSSKLDNNESIKFDIKVTNPLMLIHMNGSFRHWLILVLVEHCLI